MKKIFVAYDNNASLEGWAKCTQGDHQGRKMRGMRLWVGAEAGGWERGSSQRGTGRHRARAPNGCGRTRGKSSAARPRAMDRAKMGCWKSYVLQEAEATGREAKVSWAVGEGVEVHSMQHDLRSAREGGPRRGG